MQIRLTISIERSSTTLLTRETTHPESTITIPRAAAQSRWPNVGLDPRRYRRPTRVAATARTSYHTDPLMQPTIFLYPKDFTGITRQQGISISLFPNPATDYLRIDLGENTAGTVVLYNTIGASVLRKQFHSANIKLDLTAIESGIYFLSIESEDTNFQTRKVIVH